MWDWRSTLAGVIWFSVAACGPGQRPAEGCDGPSFNLVVHAGDAPLPSDTRINVRYGSNQEGEPYALGQPGRKQAVFCEEDTMRGGGPGETAEALGGAVAAGGAGGAQPPPETPDESTDVWSLRCRLYTQGPARVDVTATGYEPVEDRALPFDDDRCNVEATVLLTPLVEEEEED